MTGGGITGEVPLTRDVLKEKYGQGMQNVKHINVFRVFTESEYHLQKTQRSTTDGVVIANVMENQRPVIINLMCKCMTQCPGEYSRWYDMIISH